MDPLDWLMRHDQNFYLPDCLMVKTDIGVDGQQPRSEGVLFWIHDFGGILPPPSTLR